MRVTFVLSVSESESESERTSERESVSERKGKRKGHEKGFFLYTIETTHYHIGKEKKKKTCSLFTALAC